MRQLNQHQFEEQHSGEVFGRVASAPTVSRLVTAHSDKKKTAPNYKRGYGFHPLCAFVDHDHGDGGTGEPVAMLLRPGNGFDQNRIWLEIVQLACELMAWMHMLAFGADSPETARARAVRRPVDHRARAPRGATRSDLTCANLLDRDERTTHIRGRGPRRHPTVSGGSRVAERQSYG